MWQSENYDVCANILYWRIYCTNKYIFDESNGLWYESQGDYYIPCLILSEEETQPIGLWGQRHKQYLKEHQHLVYTTMLIEGTLNSYVIELGRQALMKDIAHIGDYADIAEFPDTKQQKEFFEQWVKSLVRKQV